MMRMAGETNYLFFHAALVLLPAHHVVAAA
jgi:hypothetical protein